MVGRVVGDYGGRVWWEGWRSVREGVGEGGGRGWWEKGGRRWEKVGEGGRRVEEGLEKVGEGV